MDTEISATCTCGSVRFTATQKPVVELCCHCTDCRQALGKDFATISFFKKSGTNISGDTEAFKFVSDDGNQTVREYCTSCEDVMFDKSAGFPTLIGVMSAQINPPYKSAPAAHIWVISKLSHVVIPESMRQFEKGYY